MGGEEPTGVRAGMVVSLININLLLLHTYPTFVTNHHKACHVFQKKIYWCYWWYLCLLAVRGKVWQTAHKSLYSNRILFVLVVEETYV